MSSIDLDSPCRAQASVGSEASCAADLGTVRRSKSLTFADGCAVRLKYRTHRVIKSREFDSAIGVVIVLNSAFCGLEQSYRLNGNEMSYIATAEHVFLAVYIVEIGLRFFAQGLRCLKDSWVRFDFLLVTGAVISEVLPFVYSADSVDVGPLTIVRVARLLRFARLVRVLNKFRELWMLVHGFISSAKTMCYTMLVLAVMLYVFGMIGIELITFREEAPDAQYREAAENYFSSLPMTMLTLLQFINMDSVADIYRPLILGDWTLSFYFISVIMVIAIVLMNIITAVIVNAALEQAHENREAQLAVIEKKKKRLMQKLRTMFERIDKDGSGLLDRQELENADSEDHLLLNEILVSSTTNPLEIFRALDVDGTGSLTIDEFCDGLYNASVTRTPVELKRLDKRMDGVTKQLASLVNMGQQVEAVKEQIAKVIVSQSIVSEVCDEIRREVRHLRGGHMKLSRTCDSVGEATTEDSASSHGNFAVPKDPQEGCPLLFPTSPSYSMKDCEEARAALRAWEKEEEARAALKRWEELAPSEPGQSSVASKTFEAELLPAPALSDENEQSHGSTAAPHPRSGGGMLERSLSQSLPPSKKSVASDVDLDGMSSQLASTHSESGACIAGDNTNALQQLLDDGILTEGFEILNTNSGRVVSC